MATVDRPGRRLTGRVPLLAWIVALLAVVVGALFGVVELDDAWAVAVAVGAALAATLTVVIVVRDELAETDSPVATRVLGVRGAAAALGVVAVAAIAIAVGGASADAGDASTSPATAATAVRTVRDFVVAAGVDHNGEAACGYLTPGEQGRVGATAGGECPQVFDDGTAPMPDGAASEGAVRNLPAAASVRDGRASVRLGTGDGAVTFVLARATLAEQSAFNAPASAWRIASGATSLTRGT
jgi:hypothetical protein